MRSPTKSTTKRVRDAESELNLPPGFRFHPTDEELIVHYLCRKSRPTSETLSFAAPPPIIADVDLYKHDPWDLPEMALFGTKEWYFFTPRDRKYPNGSRPNRVTGNGYWKATGADKPIKTKSDPNIIVGIKKALVFYAGRGPTGIKTNWIMHEYRLASPNPTPSVSVYANATISKLDDWVLCRLYNKKNNPNERVVGVDDKTHLDLHPTSPLDELQTGNSYSNNSESLDSFEDHSYGESDGKFEGDIMFLGESITTQVQCGSNQSNIESSTDVNEWLDGMSLDDLHRCLEAMPQNLDIFEMPMIQNSNQQYISFLGGTDYKLQM